MCIVLSPGVTRFPEPHTPSHDSKSSITQALALAPCVPIAVFKVQFTAPSKLSKKIVSVVLPPPPGVVTFTVYVPGPKPVAELVELTLGVHTYVGVPVQPDIAMLAEPLLALKHDTFVVVGVTVSVWALSNAADRQLISSNNLFIVLLILEHAV
jgi:hypothetical protein